MQSIDSSESSASSYYESCESAPASPMALGEFATSSPALPPPRLEISTSTSSGMQSKTPSVASPVPSTSGWSVRTNASDATASIRAAYRASVRKKKSFHRSSWNPNPSAFATFASTPQPVPSSLNQHLHAHPHSRQLAPNLTSASGAFLVEDSNDNAIVLSSPTSASTLTPNAFAPASVAATSTAPLSVAGR